MNYELNITIPKPSAITEVRRTAAYIGAKATRQDGETLYRHIAMAEEDVEQIEPYWQEACANAAQACKDFLKAEADDGAQWRMTLDMPSNYNTAFDGIITQKTRSYIVSYILTRWLLLCGYVAEEYQLHMQNRAAMLSALSDALYMRTTARAAAGHEGNNDYGTATPQNAAEAEATILKVKR